MSSEPTGGASAAPSRPYHPLVRVTAACTAILIGAGALVTTTGSGLSVPDWPTSFGTFFPPLSLWVNGVQFEHTHRLIAGCVALLVLASGVTVLRRDERRGVRVLAGVAMGTVLLQALLGGLTVLFKLPTVVSASHGTLAQTFFCMIVALSMVTSVAWARAPRQPSTPHATTVQMLAVGLTVAVWVQLVIGASMRHLHAGLAILDFPLSQGGLVPTELTLGIAVNFAHRVGALVVFCLAAALVSVIVVHFRGNPPVFSAGLRLGALVALQVALGAFTVWTQRNVLVTSLHVLNGALVLVTAVVVALWAFRLHGSATDLATVDAPSAPPGVTPAVQGAGR